MRYAGLFAAALVALFIAVESPISGASMNPARSLAPALGAGDWGTLWVYLVGPPLGMLLAAELHRRRVPVEREQRAGSTAGCAKLAHDDRPCRFCEYRWGRADVGHGSQHHERPRAGLYEKV